MMTIGNNFAAVGKWRRALPDRDAQAELLRLCARIGYSPHHS